MLHYEARKILQVSADADKKAIKKAYKKLASKYHPDKPTGDKVKFQRIQEAYDSLQSKEKPDPFSSKERSNGESSEYARWSKAKRKYGFDDFDFSGYRNNSKYDDYFGNNGRRYRDDPFEDFKRRQKEKEDKIVNESVISVTVKEASEGCIKKVSILTGNRVGCGMCAGTGYAASRKCARCNGEGTILERTSVSVNVPKGCINGTSIKGSPGPAENYIFKIQVTKHSEFEIGNECIICNVKVPFYTIYSGGKVKIKTVDDKFIMVTIKPGMDTSKRLRLNGQGAYDSTTNSRWPLECNIIITAPKLDSANLEKEIKDYANSSGQ